MEENKKNNLLIIIMALVIVCLLGYIVYTKFIQKSDTNTPKDNNTQEQGKNETSKEAHKSFAIKVQKSYSFTEKKNVDGETIDSTRRIDLLDNGTYCRYYEAETESHDCGTYVIDNDVLYVSSLLYGGNGSTKSLEDVKTDKYTVKENGLYEYNTNNLVYNVDNKNINTVNGGIIEELYDFLYDFDNLEYSTEQRKLIFG